MPAPNDSANHHTRMLQAASGFCVRGVLGSNVSRKSLARIYPNADQRVNGHSHLVVICPMEAICVSPVKSTGCVI